MGINYANIPIIVNKVFSYNLKYLFHFLQVALFTNINHISKKLMLLYNSFFRVFFRAAVDFNVAGAALSTTVGSNSASRMTKYIIIYNMGVFRGEGGYAVHYIP